jgi:F-type H+-transporting ATPase subunit gamma
MATVKDLRDRIRSLRNTQQITKAMKQVAAAKIRRAEIAQKQARPYADTLSEMLRDLTAAVSHVDHPFMKAGKAGAPAGVVLMTADKGLAGAFNSNLVREAEQFAKRRGGTRWYTIGVKARNAVRWLGYPDHPSWPLHAPHKLDVAREVAHRAGDDFANGEISEIVLVGAKLVSMVSQKPETRTLVPVEREALSKEREGQRPRGALEFAPSPEFVLSRLLPKYLEFTLYSAMLETDAAFFAAQLGVE